MSPDPPPFRFGALAVALAAVASWTCAPAAADTVTLAASKDNTLYEDVSGSLSNGAGESLFVGRTNNGLLRRGLLAFDVAGGVPAYAEITAARLTLNMTLTIVGDMEVELRPALADWGEAGSVAMTGGGGGGAMAETGDATWLHTFFDDQLWNQAGGDFGSPATASQSIAGSGAYVWGPSDRMTAQVQAWLDRPAFNYGWLLLGDETQTPSAKRFASRDHFDTSLRPALEIEFTPALFADGFESGNTGQWSSAFP